MEECIILKLQFTNLWRAWKLLNPDQLPFKLG